MPAAKFHGNPPVDPEAFQRVFGKFPEVEAVLLFGSHAAGKTHAESDLDLAVVLHHPDMARRKLDMLAALAREGYCNVDLVFLGGDDIVLAYEAVRHRKVVYRREAFDFAGLFSKIVRQYLDFRPYLAVQRAALKARMLDGSR